MAVSLGLDIGSNSVGSAWINQKECQIRAGTSIFPAGVDETDDKRGDPKNAKRRMARRTRITLARRAQRKRQLRLKLISAGLLPPDAQGFKELLETTDPWELRRKGLYNPLTPLEFGRILLHLAQRRGAMGLKIADIEEGEDIDEGEDGKVKKAIGTVQAKMREKNAQTFGEFIAMIRAKLVKPITTEDKRPVNARHGPREYRDAIRNKAGSYEHCADREMIRCEFAKLWDKQKCFGGELSGKLTDDLRRELDDGAGDAIWKHKGLLFGQRRQSWDLGTLGRCVLEPTERCAPHADMYASRYLVVETVNNLKIVERGKEPRALTAEERRKINDYLSGPLGVETPRKKRGESTAPPPRAKQTVTVADLRAKMAEWYGKENWPRSSKISHFRFNIESDEERAINTDWFSREIIHGAVTVEKWRAIPGSVQEGLNHAILKYDPEDNKQAEKLKQGVMNWAGLNEAQANVLLAAWQKRPKLDAKRLNMSRRAVRNLLVVMDREESWPDANRPGQIRWLTQIEARKLIAEDADFKDVTTGKTLDDHARRRYATGSKGATARDRHYMRKHLLKKNGELIYGPDGLPLAEPAPAPMISNPVVRKAIHEVRRHLVEYMVTFGRKPDAIYIELSREAKMGKKDADAALFRNRLRNRIRNDIIREFDLDACTSTQQRAAIDRVVLAVQQKCVCPLCGRTMAEGDCGGITLRTAAIGQGCEVAHIIPKASGGHNGLGNIVLAHTKCNRDMERRTPRQFWDAKLKEGFVEGMSWIEKMYEGVERPKPSEVKSATGSALWSFYFNNRDDLAKIEQFKKDIKDIQEMTNRQDAATKYAARQVMAYLSDALFDGKGLPERSTGQNDPERDRRIFSTDGMWTSRLRREWGLFFDPHGAKAHGLGHDEEHLRKEKNRGDHHHHAIDAAVIACCSRSVQILWEERERQADRDGINTANEEAMENYRRLHPLPPPAPFKSREEFRQAVRCAVFGDGVSEKPICHRPVKRKLIGELHEAFPRGPVLDGQGSLTDKFTKCINILELSPSHLREPRPETKQEAIDRLSERRQREKCGDEKAARKWARSVVSSPGYTPATIDPPPEKSGIVRDLGTRTRLRDCLKEGKLNPADFSTAQLKKLVESGGIRQTSGVPIRSVVLLWTIKDPVVVSLWATDYASGNRHKIYDATTGQGNATAARAYIGGNQHHIEIRAAKNKSGDEVWSGQLVSAFEAAQRKLARLRAFREVGIAKQRDLRKLPKAERETLGPTLRAIEEAHPLVDRRDNDDKGGRFVMSLCEGEMLYMKHKRTGEVGYFVVAKLDKPQSIVLVPHWDARAATERKTAEGNNVPDSKREQFSVTPSDLKDLAPSDCTHAVKIRVSPLGVITELKGD